MVAHDPEVRLLPHPGALEVLLGLGDLVLPLLEGLRGWQSREGELRAPPVGTPAPQA